MTLHELESPDALTSFIEQNDNTLICFSATWCGPCKRSKPDLEAMASSYSNNNGNGNGNDEDVLLKFGIVYEHNLGNAIHSYGVRAFPTYILFTPAEEETSGKTKNPVGKVEGANFDKIRALISQASLKKKKNQFEGTGNSLGGEVAASHEDAKALRLKRFAINNNDNNATTTTPQAQAQDDDDDKISTNDDDKDVEMEDVSKDTKKTDDKVELVDPTEKLDKESLEQLTGAMGFSLIRAQKGLLYGQGNTVEGAVEWLMNHQDDADIDDPIPKQEQEKEKASASSSSGDEVKSYKCNTTGKLFSSMASLELYANRTGYTDFEECTEAIVPLTEEEKAEKVKHLKELLKKKRQEREESEKQDDINREKSRRLMGKEMAKTREQMEMDTRKRNAYLRKKEKEDAKRERERIRRELAKDKAERMANKGKLSSRLGVDGYNPDGIQYDVSDGTEPTSSSTTTTTTTKPSSTSVGGPSAHKIEDYIQKVSSYRAGGDGGKCLKTLLAYVRNVVEKPQEDKFKTIKTDNKVYKAKVKPFVGAKNLLLAVGFQPNNNSTTELVLKEDADMKLLETTKNKLEKAYNDYMA